MKIKDSHVLIMSAIAYHLSPEFRKYTNTALKALYLTIKGTRRKFVSCEKCKTQCDNGPKVVGCYKIAN